MLHKVYVFVFFLLINSLIVKAQLQTNNAVLQKAATEYAKVEKAEHNKIVQLAKQKGWQISYKTKDGGLAVLARTNSLGKPMYISTHNNIIAAATTGANQLWTGGNSGLNLSGSTIPAGKIAIWDGGKVLDTHQELTGRIYQKDGYTTLSDHSTHVAGTIIAAGINPIAKGMSFGAQRLTTYVFADASNNMVDISEMFTEAPNLLLSNHSYGYNAGWIYNNSTWYWYGDVNISRTEDYSFGYYDSTARLFDSIAYNAPRYLICMSAGNSRNDNGPGIGGSYKYWDSSYTLKTAIRSTNPNISNNDSYGTIACTQNAKNILTVGAVNGIPLGYNTSSDVVMSDFSSWGPTDDGRIKPDIVADGVNVTSSISTSTTAYGTMSGTSMASPNATGSLYLLQEYYNKLHSSFMYSSTLKGLAIHTADEAGTTEGPDYQYGWGLLDVAKAANVITSSFNHQTDTIIESSLNNGATYTINVMASGKGPLTATIAWIDPPAIPIPDNTPAVLNNTTPRLVNDLDMRISQGGNTYLPWILDPANPANAATRGDNKLDNVEKIQIDSTIAGKTYTIKITHKGTLQRGAQSFSLLISGIGGNGYCTSASTSSAGTRIDSVAFAGIANKNAAGHHNYSDFTNLIANVEPTQILPITVKVNSSDGSSATRKVKVFIDYNNNGSFYDAGDLVASSSNNTIDGTGGTFTGNIAIPSNVKVGYTSIMRIIVKDSSAVTDSISACGTYLSGETQDYSIQFNKRSNDIAVDSILSPVAGACANNAQFVVALLRNKGSVAQSNIPLRVTVLNGTATVANYNTTYPGTIAAGSVENYVFQQPFTSLAGTTYTIKVTSNLFTDQDSTNNTKTTSVTIAGAATMPTGIAEICPLSPSTAYLNVTNANSSLNYSWYTSNNSTSSLAMGTSASTATIPTNKTYYLQTGVQLNGVGPVNKDFYGPGGYHTYKATYGNYMAYTAAVPFTLNAVRLYTRYPGKIILSIVDISAGYITAVYSTTSFDVYSTSPNPIAGNSSNDAADSGAYFYTNLSLPSGSHYICVGLDSIATLFRNNGVIGSPYPIGVSNLFTFTGNSATSSTNTNYYQQFYYYFYDVRLSSNDCLSAMTPIAATTASTPTISLSGNKLVSNITNGKSYQWNLSGSPVGVTALNSFYPTTGGSYTVSVTDSSGCSLTSSNAYTFVVTAVNSVNSNDIGLKVSPNPSNNGNFNVSFTLPSASNVDIELIGSTGQIYLTKHYSALTGTFSETFSSGNVVNGTYMLKIQAGNNVYWTKVAIIK